jgi:hypothetical protein
MTAWAKVASARASARVVSASMLSRVKAGIGLKVGAINEGRRNRTKRRSKAQKCNKAAVIKAGGLSGRGFEDEHKSIGMTYTPVFRLCFAILASVPSPSSLYSLILASLPFLFFVFIVVKHPFRTWITDACNPCLCPPSCCSLCGPNNIAHGLHRPLQGMR